VKGEISADVYSLILKGAEVDVEETKEKFSLNMTAAVRRGSRSGLD
jgi:hypothetical protein